MPKPFRCEAVPQENECEFGSEPRVGTAWLLRLPGTRVRRPPDHGVHQRSAVPVGGGNRSHSDCEAMIHHFLRKSTRKIAQNEGFGAPDAMSPGPGGPWVDPRIRGLLRIPGPGPSPRGAAPPGASAGPPCLPCGARCRRVVARARAFRRADRRSGACKPKNGFARERYAYIGRLTNRPYDRDLRCALRVTAEGTGENGRTGGWARPGSGASRVS
jgi:hypothetical protein